MPRRSIQPHSKNGFAGKSGFRMSRKSTLTVAAVAGVIGAVVAWPQPVVHLLQVLFPNIIWQLRTRDPVIALTFDDGPNPIYTPLVLELLRAFNVTATFFLVGERARRYSELLQQIKAEGHLVANHSDSWRRTIQLNDAEFERDLLCAEQTLGLHTAPKLFRPAGAMIKASQLRVLRKHAYSVVLGSAYAFDPYRPPTRYIEWAITRGLKPGAIVVLHDSGGDRSNSVQALPAIIRNAQAAGLRFVSLSACVPAA
jgi:peptidoglycan/xylan/chitin deacetylase (PgdA/CDA1 family)